MFAILIVILLFLPVLNLLLSLELFVYLRLINVASGGEYEYLRFLTEYFLSIVWVLFTVGYSLHKRIDSRNRRLSLNH